MNVILSFDLTWMTSKKMTSLIVLFAAFVVADAVQTSDYGCPERCRCRRRAARQHGLEVDCSNTGIQEIPSDLDPATVFLDLGGNQIQTVSKGAFSGMPRLATLLLNDNQIAAIEAHAFRDLKNIRNLDLRRNWLTELEADSLAGIEAAKDCSDKILCAISLEENPLAKVNSYALSWCKGLSLMFGNSSTGLVLKAYAFYGAEDIPHIKISDIPTLYLEHRIFTNTDMVKTLEISKTDLGTIEKFTFEGLKNVEEINIHNVRFGKIDEFGFSGILYSPSDISQLTSYSGTSQQAGGLFNISASVLPVLPSDAFRDTNLKELVLTNNDIGVIQGHAFRGLHGLFLLELTSNWIRTIQPYAFGTLKNVPHIQLRQNNLTHLVEHAFANSKGITRLSLHVKHNSSLSLAPYSFSGLRDIRMLDIRGAPGATFTVQKDAFHDLGGVNTLQITNVSLPTLGEHTFRGLNKVQVLKLEYCNISRIDGLAFGSKPGSVAVIELSKGNSLPCDCEISKLLRNFESRFARFTITCFTDDSTLKVLTQDSSDWPTCDARSGVGISCTYYLQLIFLGFIYCISL